MQVTAQPQTEDILTGVRGWLQRESRVTWRLLLAGVAALLSHGCVTSVPMDWSGMSRHNGALMEPATNVRPHINTRGQVTKEALGWVFLGPIGWSIMYSTGNADADVDIGPMIAGEISRVAREGNAGFPKVVYGAGPQTKVPSPAVTFSLRAPALCIRSDRLFWNARVVIRGADGEVLFRQVVPAFWLYSEGYDARAITRDLETRRRAFAQLATAVAEAVWQEMAPPPQP